MVRARREGEQEYAGRQYIRPSDVVKRTNLSKTTVFEALWSGELEGYRKGKAWLIPVDAVDRWIQGDTHTA